MTDRLLSERRGRLGALAFLLLLSVIAVAAAAAAADQNIVLLDAGPVVRAGGPVTALLADLAGAMTFGGAVLAGWLLRSDTDRARAMVLVSAAAATATLARLAGFVFAYALATGQSLSGGAFGSDIGVFIGTDIGVWLISGVIIAAGATTVAVSGASCGIARAVTVLAGLALFCSAMTGHAAGGDTHEVATSTMLVHLLAVGIWMGGLLTLQLLPENIRDDAAVIRGYSHLALIAWIALALSGVWALAVRMNGPSELLTSAYVQLAVAKAVLLIALGAFGVAQRRLLAQGARGAQGQGVRGRGVAAQGVQGQGVQGSGAQTRAGRDKGADVRAARASSSAPWSAGARSRYRRLAILELALMGLAVALAAAMSSSPPPAEAVPAPVDPASLLSGYPLPPAPDLQGILTAWRPDPFGMALACVIALLWWRPAGPSRPKTASARLVAGLVVLVLVTSGPLNVYGKVLVSAHLLQHALLFAGAGALIGSAVAVPAVFAVLQRHLRWAGPLLAAVPLLVVIGWYIQPTLLRAALDGHAMHLLLQTLCFAGGVGTVLLVRACVVLWRGLLAVGAVAGVASVVLIVGPWVLAPSWFGATGRPWLADALADQQRGGVALLVLTVLIASTAAFALSRRPAPTR